MVRWCSHAVGWTPLCDPLPERQHGTCHWADPVYVRLRDAITARTAGRRRVMADRPTTVALRLPCPSCGERFVYRQNGGESVRAWALKLTEDGYACQVSSSCPSTSGRP
jgi:predicted RNA-binding Zn-ribbon protein involved in translation (DUF1610 family)